MHLSLVLRAGAVKMVLMFRVARPLVLICFVLLVACDAMAESVRPLKCVTFNLLHGGVFSGLRGDGQDLDRRLEMVVQELRALEVDVIGLQEASESQGRGNVAARLATHLGFHYVYAPASFRLFRSEILNAFVGWLMNLTEGPAIVSRFPIVSWEAHDLPRCGRWTDPRVLLYAELQTPWGRLQAASTHTSGNLCHNQSVAEFLLKQHDSLPLIVMGDFNATEHSPAIRVLTEGAGFVDTFRVANPTAPGFTVWQWVYAPRPTVFRRVDYLFLLSGRWFPGRVLKSQVVLDAPQPLQDGKVLWPSDHYGVLTELEVFAPS
jgi:endonuclease/exonuclease/phosphatase family metal-dependent hydrolase